jgi:GAF domain-containing protein
VLDAVVRVALEATGATRGRLVASDPAAERLEVVAVQGGDAAWQATTPDPDSLAAVGYVIATGQPQILSRPDAGPAGAPSSALCAPCICHDEVVGALELADKAGGAGFSFDDLELAGLLAGVAGEAIVARRPPPAIDPGLLIGDLVRLAAADPGRYATVARLVQSLLHA